MFSESKQRASLLLINVLVFALSAGCVPLAGYDQQAYENATTLKAETLALMDKSREKNSFSANEAKVDNLVVSLNAAYEYANGVEHNNEAAKNWSDLIGDEEQMILAWVGVWRDCGNVSDDFWESTREQVAEGFDTIICLEANKRQLTACDSLKQD
jgi:hypothetical protein